MRILHFNNIPIDLEQVRSYGESLNTSGGWMVSLLGTLFHTTDLTLAFVAFGNVRNVKREKNNRIESVILPKTNEEHGLRMCRDLVHEWQPDLIHIHGTEGPFGLLTAREMVRCPAVISLQGLLGPYSEWYHYFGNRSLLEIVKMHRFLEIPSLRGHWMGLKKIRKEAKRELEIICNNKFFIGRTAWDRAYVEFFNPSAKYFYGSELLRRPFWQKRWELDLMQRHRIIFTNAGHPRKGTEVLLDAASRMCSQFPDLKVCIAGGISQRSGYGQYIRRKIKRLNGVAIELGQLNASQMADELARSHVFVSPSFIDNSPNAICEAQLLGMPVISTYTGGVPSLIEDGKTGLFFPTGESSMLAARLKDIFKNDSLAIHLGTESHSEATLRHDSETVVEQLLATYNTVIEQTK